MHTCTYIYALLGTLRVCRGRPRRAHRACSVIWVCMYASMYVYIYMYIYIHVYNIHVCLTGLAEGISWASSSCSLFPSCMSVCNNTYIYVCHTGRAGVCRGRPRCAYSFRFVRKNVSACVYVYTRMPHVYIYIHTCAPCPSSFKCICTESNIYCTRVNIRICAYIQKHIYMHIYVYMFAPGYNTHIPLPRVRPLSCVSAPAVPLFPPIPASIFRKTPVLWKIS